MLFEQIKTNGIINFDSKDVITNQWFDKKYFLYYDKIYYQILPKDAYRNFAETLGSDYLTQYNKKLLELDKLEKLGLIEELSEKHVIKKTINLTEHDKLLYDKFTFTSNIVFNEIKDYLTTTKDKNWIDRYNRLDRLGQELITQANSILLQNSLEDSCVPIIRYSNNFTSKFFPELKKDYLSISLHNIPTISNDTTWEQLIEFKSDEDSKVKFLALKNWFNDLGEKDINEKQFLEKIQHNLNEYREHLRIHRLKTETSKLEIVLTTTADIMENVAKFKFGSAVRLLFDITKQNLALIEAEHSAPFKEVAYLDKIDSNFFK